jgi:hypothetical protein
VDGVDSEGDQALDRAVKGLYKSTIKSLLFRGRKSGQPVLEVARGVHRVDERRVSVLVEEEMVRVDADFRHRITPRM